MGRKKSRKRAADMKNNYNEENLTMAVHYPTSQKENSPVAQKEVHSTLPKGTKQTSEERTPFLYPGSCRYNSCPGADVACRQFPNNTYTCLCTHDSHPPNADGVCPRRTVSVTVGPGRIPIQMVPQPNASTTTPYVLNATEKTSSSSPVKTAAASQPNFIVPSVIVLLISCGIIIFLTIFIKRKMRRTDGRASPVNLKRSLLLAERYAPNPQYSACSATGIPLLKKETLIFDKEVGEGCFGKVYKGQLISEDTDEIKTVAIKVLKDSANREAEEDFLREVEIMSAFRHPNILSLLGVVLKDENINPMMVFEFMPHGDLAELLRYQRRSVEENIPTLNKTDLLSISLQIAKGMKYLASQRFVHRDLACRNCLVAEGPVVKIADFGMSRDVYTCDYYKIGGSRLLPVRWMSPESVVYGRFTLESDIWSFGVVLWEIYSYGKQPYYGHSNEEVVKLILDGVMLIPPNDCPSVIIELMKNCWKTEPRHRITFPNICDKLELAYENMVAVQKTEFEIQDETKKIGKTDQNRSLPRPPPITVLPKIDLLDGQGYLLPKEIKQPPMYLETLTD